MYQEKYKSIIDTVSKDNFGEVKAIRIFKLLALDTVITKEVLGKVILEDIDFAVKILGKIQKVICKSVGYEKSIIILEHSNKRTTHLSVNLYNEPVVENFKIEVVGEHKILEQDTSKGVPIFLSIGEEKKIRTVEDFNDESYSKEINDVLEYILKAM